MARALPPDHGVLAYEIVRRPEGRPEASYSLWENEDGYTLRDATWCRRRGHFDTLIEAISSSPQLHLIKRTDHAEITCPLRHDEELAHLLIGRRGARCTINRRPWKWSSNFDVIAFLPERVRTHPRFEPEVNWLPWTVPTFPGADWEGRGQVTLSRLGDYYFFSNDSEDPVPDRPDTYLGRFDSEDAANAELWEQLDRRGYCLDGQHPGGLLSLLVPQKRNPRNSRSGCWPVLGCQPNCPSPYLSQADGILEPDEDLSRSC